MTGGEPSKEPTNNATVGHAGGERRVDALRLLAQIRDEHELPTALRHLRVDERDVGEQIPAAAIFSPDARDVEDEFLVADFRSFGDLAALEEFPYCLTELLGLLDLRLLLWNLATCSGVEASILWRSKMPVAERSPNTTSSWLKRPAEAMRKSL